MSIIPNSLYEIREENAYRSRYAYASGYTPLPDRKSFVPPAMQERNRQFIELNGSKPGIRISYEGSKRDGARWPDFLSNGCGYVSFFVSERVIKDLRDFPVDLLDVTEFPIESIEDGCPISLRIEDAPRYYILEAHPELVPDWTTMNVPTKPDGSPILTPLPQPWPPMPFIFRKDTWSGRDLVSQVKGTTEIFCSEALKTYAESKGWTNVRFERIGAHTIRNSSENR